jgi:hypothetical protein
MGMVRTSRRSLLSVGLAALLALLPTTAALAQGQGNGRGQGRPAAGVAVPVTGTLAPLNGAPAPFTGTFTVQRFANQDGELVAIGNLVATVVDPVTSAATTTVMPLAVPVDTAATTASCEILNLVLGPLDLNLLGLVVHLDQVVLDIRAVPGAGNLLGNLLCAIAGLLDGPSPLAGLVGLLNNLLGALGNL